MDIFIALNDPELDEYGKMDAMIQILYPDWKDIPAECIQEAIDKACEFIDCGKIPEDDKPKPRMIDWQQDAPLIIPEINKIARMEVRANPDIHWWTFFGWFMGIGEGLFGSVLHIRQKKAKGKKLDKWEQEYYRENKALIDLQKPESKEIRAEKDSILKFL